jgi:hypothetical protein
MVGISGKRGVRRQNKAQVMYGDGVEYVGLKVSICLPRATLYFLYLALCLKESEHIIKQLCPLSSN